MQARRLRGRMVLGRDARRWVNVVVQRGRHDGSLSDGIWQAL
jgi:hypothetical protein